MAVLFTILTVGFVLNFGWNNVRASEGQKGDRDDDLIIIGPVDVENSDEIFAFTIDDTIIKPAEENAPIITELSVLKSNEIDIEKEISLNGNDDKKWVDLNVGEYPICVVNDVWSSMSYEDIIKKCNMSRNYAKGLLTSELVEYAINYPFLMDIFAYDNIETGIESLIYKSGLFEELFGRADFIDELIFKYGDIQRNEQSFLGGINSLNKNILYKQLFIESYIGMRFSALSNEQISSFMKSYEKVCMERIRVNQNSKLFYVFYETLIEKNGNLLEKAILDVDVSSLLDLKEKKTLSATRYPCFGCGALMERKYITIKGERVLCDQWIYGGYSEYDIALLDEYIDEYHPTFYKERSASSKYNCHSYAWYSTSPSNIYWVIDPSPVYQNALYWKLWKNPMRALKKDDRITFWNDDDLLHSAIMVSQTKCSSKLGHYGVYTTTISEMMTFYEANKYEAYIQ